MKEGATMFYRVLPNMNQQPAHKALAPRYTLLEDAWAVMAEGIIEDNNGRLVAFHARHLPWVEFGVKNGSVTL